MRGKRKKQVITDPDMLEGLVRFSREQIVGWHKDIIKLYGTIARYEKMIDEIKETGQYVQYLESNIK